MSQRLSVTRELFVPRHLIFQAWTEPEHLSAWYSPPGVFSREVSIDLRPGGEYLFAWTGEDGVRFVHRGAFHAVDAPGGFRCSQWLEGGFADHFGTELEVVLRERGGASRIRIDQEGFPSEKARDVQLRLWDQLLDQLESYFSVI